MATYYPKLVLDALTHVIYPGAKKNVVELGMVEDNIRIEGNKISFSLIFNRPNDPFAKSLVKACEQAILTYMDSEADIKGNISIKTKPIEVAKQQKPLAQVKNIVAVTSGKGGVGKSTIAANLAVSLSNLGYKVGLLDADITGPSIPKMFGIEDARPMAVDIDGKQMMEPIEVMGIKILSIGFFVNPDEALIWRGAMLGNALKQLINDADWGELDYFVVDMPPGTSDVHLTLVQTIDVTGVVVVSTPQQVALADARKGIQMFENDKINIPILGLVENMAWFTPAELPENKYYIFGNGGCKQLAEEKGLPLLGQIPLVQSICESGDAGSPISFNENSLTAQAFKKMAENVVDQLNKLKK